MYLRRLVFRVNTNHSTLLRGSWYPVGLSAPATFHLVLANSQRFIHKQLHGSFDSTNNTLSLSHYTEALKLFRKKMSDPRHIMSDELIGTVAAFMCHDVRILQI
jgi:hypothetical protein